MRDVAAGDSFPSVRNPLVALARYKEHEMPEHSQELASLKNRLDTAYEQEIEEAQRHEPRLKLEKDVQDLVSFAGEDDDMPGDPAEYKSSYTLLRMLLEAECDHLGLEEVAKLSESGFPLHLTHASLLRQIFPESSGDLPKPFDPPPPYVSLVPVANNQTRSNAIKASIGLLQPFLQARSESAYDLYDDDHLPLPVDSEVRKSLATRPDVPYTTGRVVLSKRKRDAAVPAPSLPASTGLNLTTGQPMPTGGVSRPLQVAEKAKKIRAAV